jgi:hypothetical protein
MEEEEEGVGGGGGRGGRGVGGKDNQVLIGIKIPTDGTRHKHYFNKRDQLRCIVLFAEEVSGEDFSNHILILATNRQRLDNLSQTIESAGLESKSVVHLEELD